MPRLFSVFVLLYIFVWVLELSAGPAGGDGGRQAHTFKSSIQKRDKGRVGRWGLAEGNIWMFIIGLGKRQVVLLCELHQLDQYFVICLKPVWLSFLEQPLVLDCSVSLPFYSFDI